MTISLESVSVLFKMQANFESRVNSGDTVEMRPPDILRVPFFGSFCTISSSASVFSMAFSVSTVSTI